MLEKYLNKYEFIQLKEYINKLIPEITNEEAKEEYGWITIKIHLKSGIDLKVLICEPFNESTSWFTFYYQKDSINIEKIDFIIMNDNTRGYNRVIRQDYFILEKQVATTFNSGYTFIDNEYQSGWKKIRQVYYKDISHYAGKGDNLANLSSNIDHSGIEILFKENKDEQEEPTIEIVSIEKCKSKNLK